MWSELLFAVNSNWTEIAIAVKLKILATLLIMLKLYAQFIKPAKALLNEYHGLLHCQ